MSQVASTPDAPVDSFGGTHNLSRPYKAGLPRLKPYFQEVWSRRGFAREMSKTTMRATYADTILGRSWDLLNPIFSGLIYFLLVAVISGGIKNMTFFATLMMGLYVFQFNGTAMSDGTKSIVGAGGIILNTPFPKVLLPLSFVWTELQRYLLSLIIMIPICLLAGVGPSWTWLIAIPWTIFILTFAVGISLLMACAQVYFRDAGQLVPYVSRIWLYACPILWAPIPATQFLEYINPLYSMIYGLQEAVVYHRVPDLTTTLLAFGWSVVILIVGAWVFMARERDFAIRI